MNSSFTELGANGPEWLYLQREESLRVERAIFELPAREREFITCYFGLRGRQMQQKDLAAVHGISPTRVQQVIRSGLHRLLWRLKRPW